MSYGASGVLEHREALFSCDAPSRIAESRCRSGPTLRPSSIKYAGEAGPLTPGTPTRRGAACRDAPCSASAFIPRTPRHRVAWCRALGCKWVEGKVRLWVWGGLVADLGDSDSAAGFRGVDASAAKALHRCGDAPDQVRRSINTATEVAEANFASVVTTGASSC